MGSYLIGIMISLIVGIIVAVIIFNLTAEKKKVPEVKKDEKADHSEHSSNKHETMHESEHSADHGSKLSVGSAILSVLGPIAIIVIVVAVIWGGVEFIKYKTHLPKTPHKTEIIEQKWVIVDKKIIPLNNEFSKVYSLSYDDRFTFENSTQPYCVSNKINHIECGGKGEDISTKMGTTNANKELRFKRSSCIDGEIKLVIWRLVTFKH